MFKLIMPQIFGILSRVRITSQTYASFKFDTKIAQMQCVG
jgi:hypothetical protein